MKIVEYDREKAKKLERIHLIHMEKEFLYIFKLSLNINYNLPKIIKIACKIGKNKVK